MFVTFEGVKSEGKNEDVSRILSQHLGCLKGGGGSRQERVSSLSLSLTQQKGIRHEEEGSVILEKERMKSIISSSRIDSRSHSLLSPPPFACVCTFVFVLVVVQFQ